MARLVFYNGTTELLPVTATLSLACFSPSGITMSFSGLPPVYEGDMISIFQENDLLVQTFIISFNIKGVSTRENSTGITSSVSGDGYEDYANYFGFIIGGGDAADGRAAGAGPDPPPVEFPPRLVFTGGAGRLDGV